MSHETRTVFTLRAGSHSESELRVRKVEGRERLSEPFDFTVDFATASGEFLVLADLVGAEAHLTLKRPGGPERSVHGMVWRAEMTGVAAGKPSYRVRLVPRLERLKHMKRSRVFQGLSAAEVVKKVLDEHRVKYRQSLSGNYSQREYCVQYRESDYDFVSRLLEDEGIWYRFEHGSEEQEMVIADANGGCVDLPDGKGVRYRVAEQVGDRAEDEHIYRLERGYRLRPGKVELRDYDFEQPEKEVKGQSQAQRGPEIEVYEYPGGFQESRAGSRRAQLRLEELRFGAETYRGESTCLRFTPGARFEVEGHGDRDYDQELLLVEVRHQGEQQEGAGEAEGIAHGYRNVFTALEASVPYRPLRRTARPKARPTTAVVVGPANEEVHVDQYGRIKAQLHWDREGAADDSSSCWMRMAQAWAGAAWGAQVTPRVGQEVHVEFVDGDPDKPLVMGAIYNGQNRPPIRLPDDKSQSTLRSASSPGSWGSNELRFEDLKDGEEVYLHAQRDELIEVEKDKTQRVGADESLRVAKDRRLQVYGNQELSVARNDESSIGVSQTLAVSGDREVAVGGSQTETVGLVQAKTVKGERTVTVDAAAGETVGAAAALNVGGAYAINVGGALNHLVGGAFTGEVGGWRLEAVGLAREERVGGDSEAKVGGDFAAGVNGSVTQATEGGQKEDISGRQEIEVQGSVHLSAKEFDWEAAEKVSIVVGGKLAVQLDSSGITFFATSLTVDGQTIALKAPSIKKVTAGAQRQEQVKVRKLEPLAGDRTYVEIELTDMNGKPLANEPFSVEFSGGVVRKGATDSSGHAKVPGPAGRTCKVGFTRLDAALWDEKRVESSEVEERSLAGTAKSHTVRAGECVASLAWAHGYHWQTLWSHPRNESLRRTRESPNVLLEGDVLFIHDKRLKTIGVRSGEMHRFEAKLPLMPIRIRAMKDGSPCANVPYVLELDGGTRVEGKMDGNGYTEVTVSPNVRSGTLRLETAFGQETRAVWIGHLDPVIEINGLQQRLCGLGFACEVTGELDEATRLALADFQRQSGIDATGQADEQTRKKLLQVHGS